jgi:iduronate 2-sulfatase
MGSFKHQRFEHAQRFHMKTLSLLSAVFVLVCATGLHGAEAKKNVLFLISDDLNCDLGCYGATEMKTPNIDKLAQRGIRFERAYCQFPLCSPSRASFLTGRRPNTTQVLANPSAKTPVSPHFREFVPDTVTLPQLFKKNGRLSTRVGKLYHYGVPNDIGTSSLDDFHSWDLTVNPRGLDREIHDQIFTMTPGQFGGTVSWLAAPGEDREHTDGIGATEAVRLLERFKQRNENFFLAVGFYRPHTPYVAPKKWFDLYPLDKISLPSLSDDDQSRTPAPAYRSSKKDQDAMTDDQRKQAIQAYHASTSFMDAQVGVVIDALDRLGLAKDTVIVFTSDHGYHLADHGLWQKMSLFERSARVPLIIATPDGKNAGKEAKGVVELVDLYPTLAELCGLDAPDYLEGTSLVPALNDPAARIKPAAFTQVRRGNFDGYAARTDRWRYIEWDGGEKGAQLYDEQADPGETKNLAADPAHAATVAELKALISKVKPAR